MRILGFRCVHRVIHQPLFVSDISCIGLTHLWHAETTKANDMHETVHGMGKDMSELLYSSTCRLAPWARLAIPEPMHKTAA